MSELERGKETAELGKVLQVLERMGLERLASTIPAVFEEVTQEHAAELGESPMLQRMQQVLRKQCRRTLALLAG